MSQRKVDTFYRSNESTLDVPMGRSIGFDFARLGLSKPNGCELSFAEGFADGSFRYYKRVVPSSQWERKALRLRYSAWKRNRIVDDGVTPEYLEKINVSKCPITRIEMTSGTGTDTDSTVDRVFNGGAYAKGNLAVISNRANIAKANWLPAEICEIADTGKDIEGLSSLEWRRLASLCTMATPHEYRQLTRPLLVWPPPGLLISNGYVIVMQGLTLVSCCLLPKQLVSELRLAMNGKSEKKAFDEFLYTLLATATRVIGTGGCEGLTIVTQFCDVWGDATVWTAFQKLQKNIPSDRFLKLIKIFKKAQSDSFESLSQNDLDAWSIQTRGYR